MNLAVVRLQALDHDLVLSDQVIDEHRVLAAFGLDDNHDSVFQPGDFGLDVQHVVQRDDREVVAPNMHHHALASHGLDVFFGRLQ